MTALSILKQIEQTSSRTEKEVLLENNSKNEYLKKLIYMTYNPFLQFYIKKIPKHGTIEVYDEAEMTDRFGNFMNLLDDLSSRSITGNEAITELSAFLDTCTSVESEWYEKVVQKDLKSGITEKTANKVYGSGFIPTFDCMLAEPMKDTKQLPKRALTEPKLDGMRFFSFVYESGEVEQKSRNGKLITGFTDVANELKECAPRGYVYDGEIMSPEFMQKMLQLKQDYENGVCSDEKLMQDNTSFNNLMKKAFKKGVDNKSGVYCIFDVIPIDEFMKQQCTETQIERKIRLYNSFDESTLNHIMIVHHKGIFSNSDVDAIYKMYEYYLRIGYEGVMIKDVDAPYQYKRTKQMLKLKPMDLLDLEVIDLVEGDDKYQGMLGAAVVDYKGYSVNVGSGYTDTDREFYWNNPNELIGKIIMVQSQEETTNDNGTVSLRFPVFKGIREDK